MDLYDPDLIDEPDPIEDRDPCDLDLDNEMEIELNEPLTKLEEINENVNHNKK